MGWIIYDKTGEIERCTIKELEYNGSFMGERTVTCSFESPSVINFAIGDHITYRGEEFYLDYDPSQTKSASFGSALNAFKYDLIFRTIDIELQNCQLLDYVPYGNDYHYQPSPSFSFVGTAKTLAERIQANMNRDYPGWEIEVYDGVETEDAEIEIDNVSCWNALVMINKKFGLNFFISKRNVKIGYPEESLDHTFYYGKNNGLYQIERDVNADEVVVTRLYAYGGERNIPDDYNKRDSDFSGKKNLMLPGYLETGKNYIESKNISAYGIRECTMVFEDIYPSIAGVELPDIGRIDELVAAEQITKETETKGTFKITIKNIGFNIKDYLTTETATISMKSGSLIGYEFEIVDVVQLESGNYDITLNKSTRDDFQVPNAGQNLSAGDRFVILNIKMPEKYVEYAEDRLLKAATSCLAKHDHVFYTYNIGVDEIYMARNGNLHDLIREGMKLPLYDVDFGTDYSIIIQSLSIREGESIPTYDISLSDKPIASTIDKIWDAIDNVRNEGSTSTGGSIIGGGASPEELNKKYLRKDVNDTAKGSIHFEREIGSSIFIDGWEGKGWEIQSTGAAILDSLRVRSDIYVGGNTGSPTFASGFTGWGWQIDTLTATGEMDNLFIRKTFTAYEIVYSQIYGLGGSQIVSDINKIARVEVMSDRYRCYMDDMDGLMLMNLRKGDGVRIQTRTGTTSIKYLFGRCIGVDSDYFDIAIPLIEGTGQPEAGDFALRWGNNEDTDRQGLIYLTTADSGAPFIDVYDGITDASTEGKLKARIGHLTGIRTQRGDQLSGYGAYLNGIYVENSTFILQNGDTIEQTFIAMNGKFESLIDSIRNDISAEGGNILVNSSFSQNTNYWTAANNVHFINVGGEYLWLDGSFYVEKDQVADIYNDNGQNVLRIRNTYILQQNAIMNIPDHTEEEEKTYSFSLFYKVLRPGSCGFGIPGTELYHEEQLSESDSYQKLSKVGKWNGEGDFELRFTGEILIYGVGLFSDEIADAIVKLQTQIDQTDEYIKLLATKDYVDSETGEIYVHFDSQLQITAEQMSGISTKVDNINNTIESAGWITQADAVSLFASKNDLKTLETSVANLSVEYDQISSAVGTNTQGIKDAADLANKAFECGLYSQEQYSQTNDPWQSWPSGQEFKHVGALWYNPSTKITKRYIGVNGTQSWETVNDNAVSAASFVLQNKDKWRVVVANFDADGNPTEESGIMTTAYGNNLYARKDNIISSINQSPESITLEASKINLKGATQIGSFTITEYGWFKCNASPGEDVGYIDMIGENTRIAFGRNLAPSSTGGSFTCTAIIKNHNKASSGGTTYGLSVSASGDVSTDVKPIAVDCNGGLRVKGNFGIIEDVFTGPNIAPSDSRFSSAKNLRNQRTYIYQPTSDITVNLPSDSAIKSEFGYFNSGHAVVDNSAIIIILLVTKWATGRIYVAAKGGTNNNIINENGDTINEASGSNTGFWMGKGDSAILMYFNKNWYIINRNS
jgi:hypothetical protein